MDNNGQNQPNSQIVSFEEVKKETVSALSELISQSNSGDPKDRFMMAITALKYSDDPKLAQAAFDAANSIEDYKTKSDMLLRVLAEIGFIEDSSK